MLIHDFLQNSANNYANKTAVIHDGNRVNFGLINRQACALAGHLRSQGVKKGDRVVILIENSIEYIVSYYAVLKIGAVVSPLNPGLKPVSLQYLLKDLGALVIITSFKSERLLKAVLLELNFPKLLIIKDPRQKWSGAPFKVSTYEEALSDNTTIISVEGLRETDLASIIYTSGSTGQPKGVMLSHKNIVSNTLSICSYLSIDEKEIQMVVLPFFYVMGTSLLNTHVATGGTIVINNRFLYPADVVLQMVEEQVTAFSGVPSTYAYLLNRSPLANCRDKLTNLRYCSQAGGHMSKSLKLALRNVLPAHTKIVIMYGATEAAARLTYLDPEKFESKIESIGKPIPGVSIKLLDANSNVVGDGKEGELVASGPNIMMGYWRAPQDTDNVLNEQGFHTGDIGHRDNEGFLYVSRRKDGLLKVGGHRINPIEMEDFLMTTEKLIEASVIGLPDKLMGNKLIALVVAKEAACDPNTLKEACAAGLPKHKWPSEIIMVPALPKNANGKVDRYRCTLIATKKTK